jgi:hypothetical protein
MSKEPGVTVLYITNVRFLGRRQVALPESAARNCQYLSA